MMACAVQRLGNTIFALALVGGLIPVSGWSEPIQAMLWKPVSIGAGGYITGIASDPENRTRLIRTDVYGGYRWDATQDRWVQLVTSDAMPAEDRVQNGMASGVFAMARGRTATHPGSTWQAKAGFTDRQTRVLCGTGLPTDASFNSMPTPRCDISVLR